MENAVQALLIAAGMLIGGLILSLGISLYSSLGEYVNSSEENIVSKNLDQFNEQFIKFINCNDITDDTEYTLTIHDIITAASTAYENNEQYELTGYQNNNYYVTVTLDGVALETDINSEMTNLLTEKLGQEYKCSIDDVKVNAETGRVYEVNFHTIP